MKIFNLLKNLMTKVASALSVANDTSNKLKTAGIGAHTGNICDTTNLLMLADKYNGAIQWVYAANATSLTNRPSAWTSGAVVCYRQVMMYYSSSLTHAVVVLWEVYPVPGRLWVNTYNSTWRGWKSVTLGGELNSRPISHHYSIEGW